MTPLVMVQFAQQIDATMTRYLVRSGCEGDWIVWDRKERRPATIFGQKLTRLSRTEADAALARLERCDGEPLTLHQETWQVSFQGNVVDCRDELDAKRVARDLIKRGYRVKAQSTGPAGPVCLIGHGEIWAWVLE